MTQGIPPPPSPRKWGYTEPGSKRWQKRYDRLKSEGFVHEEAARLATGIMGSKAMRRGRRERMRWYAEARRKGLRPEEIEDAIDDMYDTEDWRDPWSQFYPEEE